METFRFSGKYFITAIMIFAIEVLIAIFIHDQLIRPYVGDVLVMFLLYAIIKSFYGKPTKRVPYYLFGFALVVEFTQLLGLVERLGVQDNVVLRTILGITFDIKDIVCYFIGMLLLLGYEQALRKDISFL
ncbi:MAG: DUF2809 domain-containing protein [Vallitaleaceae bacterium]|nr:DUF2809 domain-containing protein [Vallitaleaceae bacterium]